MEKNTYTFPRSWIKNPANCTHSLLYPDILLIANFPGKKIWHLRWYLLLLIYRYRYIYVCITEMYIYIDSTLVGILTIRVQRWFFSVYRNWSCHICSPKLRTFDQKTNVYLFPHLGLWNSPSSLSLISTSPLSLSYPLHPGTISSFDKSCWFFIFFSAFQINLELNWKSGNCHFHHLL